MEYYPRKIEKDLEPWLKRKEIIVIKGARQTGKTTLLLHLAQRLGGVYLTLEDDQIKEGLAKDPKAFVERFGKKRFLFLDEVQYLENIGKILKLLFDLYQERLKLIVTGSGSFDIKVQVSKYLVGRAVFFEVFPLDFGEFLCWKERSLYNLFLEYKEALLDWLVRGKNLKLKPVFEKEFLALLEEYLVFGGFPGIVKEKDEEIKRKLLSDLTKTYLERDIFFFLGLRHLEKFKSFLRYLAFNSGSLLNFANISSELKIDYKTITNYFDVLVNTYIIFPLSPFYQNLSTELKKAKKAYLLDLGLRNSLMNNFLSWKNRADKGILWESYVFGEIKKIFQEPRYWRTTGGAEVDFVIQKEGKILPFEVKSESKLKKGFLSFLKTYQPERAIVFTFGEFGVRRIVGTEVLFCPHFFI